MLLIQTLMIVGSYETFASDDSIFSGPRVDEIQFLYYATPDAETAAIQKGEIDVVSDLIRPTDVQSLSQDPNLQVTFTLQTHYCYIGFNLRQEPLDSKPLRKAIAHLIPREEISNQIFQGLVVTPMLYEVSPSFGKWHNPNVQTYAFDPSLARQTLVDAGYSFDSTGALLNPQKQKIQELIFISPTQEEAPTSFEISRLVVENMKTAGIPVRHETVAFDTMLSRIYRTRDFDIFFLCVSGLGRYPRWLYDFYHSNLDIPDGDNSVGTRDEKLDSLLYAFRFEDSNEEQALKDVFQAQEIIADLAARVPIYSRYKVEACRKGWVGMIDHKGSGYFDSRSFYTWLNIHKEEQEFGGVFKASIGGKVRTLNPLYGSGAYESKIWGLIYDSLLQSEPESGDPIPYLATSWKIENILTSEGRQQQLITYQLAKNVTWQDGKPFTSDDVKFSFEFIKEYQVPTWLPGVEKVVSIEAPDAFTVKILLDGVSIFNLIDTAGVIILPKHIWKDVGDNWNTFQPDLEKHPEKPELTKLIGTGPFILSDHKPGEYWRLTWNPQYFKRPLQRRAGEGVVLSPQNVPLGAGIGVAAIVVVAFSLIWLRRRKKKAMQNELGDMLGWGSKSILFKEF